MSVLLLILSSGQAVELADVPMECSLPSKPQSAPGNSSFFHRLDFDPLREIGAHAHT